MRRRAVSAPARARSRGMLGHRPQTAMKFAILIHRTAPEAQAVSRATDRAALAGHRALQTEATAAGQLVTVARLDVPSTGKHLRKGEAAHEITEAPFIETKEWLVGFYVLECDDEAHAIARARMLAVDDAHAFEVRPITWALTP
jgi:hypothetical protein